MWFWIAGQMIRWGLGLFVLGGLYFAYTSYGCKQIQGPEMAGRNQSNSHFPKDAYKMVFLKERSPDALKPGDIVFYDYQFQSHLGGSRNQSTFVGRIIGKPGDRIRIEKGKVHRNGELFVEDYLDAKAISDDDMEEIVVPINSFFILCDNRHEAKKVDSRSAGPIGTWAILGRARE